MFFEKVCMFFKKYICFLKKYVCFLKKYIFFEKAYIFFVRLLLVHRTGLQKLVYMIPYLCVLGLLAMAVYKRYLAYYAKTYAVYSTIYIWSDSETAFKNTLIQYDFNCRGLFKKKEKKSVTLTVFILQHS